MSSYVSRSERIGWEDQLLGLSGLVAVACVVFIWQQPSPESITVPAVLIPFGVAVALSVYTVYLKWDETVPDEVRLMVQYGWAGAVLSAVVGGAELALYLFSGLPISPFPDKLLSFVSVGIVTGVLAGRTCAFFQDEPSASDRDRVLVETSWINRSGQTPIMMAIVEALAEVKDTDSVDVDPFYDHVDPDTLTELQAHDGSPWQFTVYTDNYEIRISSHGTVTVYALDTSTISPSRDPQA